MATEDKCDECESTTAHNLVQKLAKLAGSEDEPSDSDCCVNCNSGVEKLKEGNRKFLDSGNRIDYLARLTHKMSPERRSALAGGQTPYVTVVTCSDSRVPPELIFNGGLGEIFVVRNAGNTWDDSTLASVQYGVVHLKTPVLVVLGHQNCGAIVAAMSTVHSTCMPCKKPLEDAAPASDEPVSGEEPASDELDEIDYLSRLMTKLEPAVMSAVKINVPDGETKDWMSDPDSKSSILQCAVEANVCNTAARILSALPDVRAKVDSGEVALLRGCYALSTGEVSYI